MRWLWLAVGLLVTGCNEKPVDPQYCELEPGQAVVVAPRQRQRNYDDKVLSDTVRGVASDGFDPVERDESVILDAGDRLAVLEDWAPLLTTHERLKTFSREHARTQPGYPRFDRRVNLRVEGGPNQGRNCLVWRQDLRPVPR